MKRHKHSILAVLAALLWGSLSATPYRPVWEIGRKDGSAAEFALYNGAYSDLLGRFPGAAAAYDVGRSTPGEIPYILPGPQDGWAGNGNGSLLIRFGADAQASRAEMRLTLYLVESQASSPPTIEISAGGFRTSVQAPAGDDINYPDTKRTSARGLAIEALLPAGTFGAGENLLTIRNAGGSWLVWDAIVLEADRSVKCTRPGDGIALIGSHSQPGLIYGRTEEELLHPVTLTLVNWGKPQRAGWNYDGKPGGTVALSRGINTVEVNIPEGYEGRTVDFEVHPNRGKALSAAVEIAPADKYTVYLVQHTHTDIGYTKPQTEILTEHLRYIDYAVEYCDLTADYPDDAKFRWTCEASWPVREWLRIRPKAQVDKFIRYVKAGQIEVTAMFFNMSELSGENNYKTFLEPVARFRELGLPVETAMQNDVNGIAWCLADYLPDLGVKYFSIGSNNHRALVPFDRPTLYRWESPSGKGMLMFRSDHYHTGNSWGIHTGDMARLEDGVFGYIRNLKRTGYPFPVIAVQYSGYLTDNSPPSMRECDLIRAWNERYAWPKLRSATAHEFLGRIDSQYGDKLPVYRAAYPDWWTDGFGSAARETAASRKTQSDLVAIEAMLSMAQMEGTGQSGGTHEELRRIHENLLFYDEHTFGAAESIWNPGCENSQVQWAEKGSYVWEALKSTQLLYEDAIGRLQGALYRSTHPTLTFFNPLGWERSELATVYIDFELIPADREFRIVDAAGKALRVQPIRSRREGRYYAIWAEGIPAMGYKTFEIVLGDGKAAAPRRTELRDNSLENDFYRIVFDPASGTIASLYDKELGREMVDPDSEWKLGAFVYESLNGDRRQMERKVFDNYRRSSLSDVHCPGVTSGDIYQSVRFTGKAEGCDEKFGVQVEVRLYNDVKRVELGYDFIRNPETDPSAIYVAMPWLLENAKLTFDVPGGVVRSGEDQIPGTSASWNTVQNFVAARNDDAQILVSGSEVPLYLLGKLLDDPYGQPRTYEKPHVFPWLMNNYWTTNFRASQEGEFKCGFVISSTRDTSNTAASQFGWSARIPLCTRVMPAATKANGNTRDRSFLRSGCSHVLITSCTPAAGGEGILVNLRETDGQAGTLTLLDASGRELPFTAADATGRPLDGRSVTSLALKPYENRFVLLK